LERLEQENKSLKDKVPFDEKKAFELNVLLESNLKDLRKKLEQSQVERLTLEDQNNTYVKSMKDKNVLIASLEKQIAEMKGNFFQGNVNNVNLPMAGNIIRKITGGIK
jgi:predicted RNase H-like nuclease (RuvC/YqgF family)